MDLCNRSDIQALLARHGFHFSKSMGQNFLIESWVPAQIADASGADAGEKPHRTAKRRSSAFRLPCGET